MARITVDGFIVHNPEISTRPLLIEELAQNEHLLRYLTKSIHKLWAIASIGEPRVAAEAMDIAHRYYAAAMAQRFGSLNDKASGTHLIWNQLHSFWKNVRINVLLKICPSEQLLRAYAKRDVIRVALLRRWLIPEYYIDGHNGL